ncbi:LysM peptidoglycan-binding domain-containing protein [Oceanirhabdus sp. W0125-5]|uniref:LysM peptidoglycan-binding domain-containing protein n=1 Tax=Oceanirhabdus sp. W0125-5 TaxID=2999116 RepID=UPI0022F2B170|nr:LysM peptidoglycan-binding domain-containing protein [Oceanirhabdus sp. W0125-5]WBW96047.1 LysM peptidoglycan-binding domain-containing protein [Oceanirhabdus sp. W0125-5]
MEFWFELKKEKFRLPVPPADFSVTKGNNNSTALVEGLGEITLIGQKRLSTVSISSFFPNNDYGFCQYSDYEKPYYYVELLEECLSNKESLGFFITETNIDMECSIESFAYGERDGTGDVYFTLELKEYSSISGEKVINKEYNSSDNTSNIDDILNSIKENLKRDVKKEPPRTYSVKAGDCLYLIAKRFYGDGSKWPELYNKNINVVGSNPNLIYPGQVLTL